jgi:predicted aspartyl protease
MTSPRLARLIPTLLFAAPLACFAQAPECKLVDVAEWPVRLESGVPITAGAIDGHPVSVMIDTGSAATLVSQAAADRLRLRTRRSSELMSGIGGDSRVLVARLDELRIGADVRAHVQVHVGGDMRLAGVDVILGEDLLHTVDLEFDYAHGVVRAFQPEGCGDTALAYWDRNAEVMRTELDDRAVRFSATLDGRDASAMLDSGAASSLVAMSFAQAAGLAPGASGVSPAGCIAGIGGQVVRTWIGRFDSVRLAGETIRDARLRFADFALRDSMPWVRAPMVTGWRRSPDLILGTDFLLRHRVLVARSQDRLYFTYLGGTVFVPATPGECGERGQLQ